MKMTVYSVLRPAILLEVFIRAVALGTSKNSPAAQAKVPFSIAFFFFKAMENFFPIFFIGR